MRIERTRSKTGTVSYLVWGEEDELLTITRTKKDAERYLERHARETGS